MSGVQRKILNYLCKQSANTQLEIAKAIKSHQPNISRNINPLLNDEIVIINENRQYCINPILKKQTIDWEMISYTALSRRIRLFRDSPWDKIILDGIKSSKIFQTLDPLKSFTTMSIKQATVFQTTDIAKTIMESALAIKKLSPLIDFSAMTSMRNDMLHNMTAASNIMKSFSVQHEKVLAQLKSIQSEPLRMASTLFSGINRNLLLDNQQMLKMVSDSLPYNVLQYHNQLTKSFNLHNQLFPDPYNELSIEEYEENNFSISIDFIYRASLPVKPIIEPYEQLDIQTEPPKDRLTELITKLESVINQIDPLILDSLYGGINALGDKDNDYLRHAAVSIRSVIKSILSNLAPRNKVSLHFKIKKNDITMSDKVKYVLDPGISKVEREYLLGNTNILIKSDDIFDKLIHQGELTHSAPGQGISETAIVMTIEYLILLLNNIKN